MTGPLKTVTLAALRAMAAQEPRGWLINSVPLLPRSGLVLVVGDPLAGKSSFCACVATAMAAADGIGKHGVKQGRVMWLSGEHTRSDIASKFERACAGRGMQCEELEDDLVFLNEPTWTLDSDDDVDRLANMAEDANVDLVVLDSLRRFSAADENSSQAVADALKQARKLVVGRHTGVSKRLVVLIHHLGRNGSPRGSTDLKAAADGVVLVERRPAGWRLRAEHHTGASSSWEATVTQSDEVLRVEALAGTTTGTSSEQVRDAIKRALARKGPLGKKDLRQEARANGASAKTDALDAAIGALIAEGAVEAFSGTRGRLLHKLASGVGTPIPHDTTTRVECPS